ncbi:MAG: enterotoxin [Candidatus Sulfotelmatobacter sp.]
MNMKVWLHRRRPRIVFMALALLLPFVVSNKSAAQATLEKSGDAVASVEGKTFSLSNEVITHEWSVSDEGFRATRVINRLTGEAVPLSEAFAITISEGGVIWASAMTVVSGPEIKNLIADSNSPQRSLQFRGKQIEVHLEDKDRRLSAVWRGILRDGSNYVRQELTLQAKDKDVSITSVRLIDLQILDLQIKDLQIRGAHVSGAVKGSPIIVGNMFFGFEHPLSESRAIDNRAIAAISRELPLKAGQSVTYSSVIGVTVPGQMRRVFLHYVERERAHPYRTFLHYNSWYDLGYFNKYDEQGAVDVINAIGTELTRKRGVTLDSFLFDDGWDDDRKLWTFNSGFPNGFMPVKEAAAKYDAAPGIWLSPWGGYGEPHRERVKLGKEQGFETNEKGFMLSGPKYYARFRDTCLEMIRKYGVNQFKIDGTGNADQAFSGSEFDSDFAAAIHLIGELRTEKPDLYINLTTGTYPSPFWLRYADSIWRGGDDHSFAGVGSYRQRWITYRDSDTYAGIVLSGPLFPVNSLMLHGMIYARHARHLDTDPNNDFGDEIHDYFGTGTQLQEMYITPSLLSPENWNTLAEAAKWSRENADVLVDTHWVGGDPAMLEVYGWASWSPSKGILTLRNPGDKPQDFLVDVQTIFELPDGAAQHYSAHSPWQKDRGQSVVELQAGKPYTFHLQPFQVINLDVLPKN